jgi:hypothetical protein
MAILNPGLVGFETIFDPAAGCPTGRARLHVSDIAPTLLVKIMRVG